MNPSQSPLPVPPMTPPEPASHIVPATLQPATPPPLVAAQTPVMAKLPADFYDKLTHWLFRFGFASIFLVNSVYAALRPQDFTQLLYSNPITSAIGFADLMVKIALVNDLLLGVFILGGWRKKFVYAWAGVWLLIVAGIKLMNLVV